MNKIIYLKKLLLDLSVNQWKECPLLNKYYEDAKEYLKDCESGILPWSATDIKSFAVDDILNKLKKT